ncbi:unnamed protein product [Adineta steineri]|uniref:Tubulin-tyrosine ligase family protein n=1 Tax=Adineta steineri TaxID=433720 RepID=A0A814S4U8_9BILA|nr:unnamed protein product [Adineta steineri]
MTSKTPASTLIKQGNKKSRKRMPKVDTSQARSNIEVLRMCLQDLGWRECVSGSSTDSDIYWHSATFHEGNRNYASTSARVNKFPGMSDLLCKSNLTRSLNAMRMLFPDEFDFYPKTWFLPEQKQQFQDDARLIHQKDRKRHRPLTTFIIKPSDGSEGAGIYLVQDPTRCTVANRPYIAQEYIDRPLLINGLKFDMRIYVLIFHLDPLEILLYDEGLARFATIDYQAPSIKNLHETFMHLTNYSLNKRSASYKHALDEKQTDASKRKMSLVWSQLGHLFSPNEIDQAKEMIKEMINKTVLAILPELRIQYASEFPMNREQNRCFQIIGFDILLTDQLKPMLLEVNANPSLRIDFDHTNEAGKLVHEPSLIDEEIKKPLVLETLKLVMKYKQRGNRSKPLNNETENQGDKNIAHNQIKKSSKVNKTAAKIHHDRQLSQSDSHSSDSSSEDVIDELPHPHSNNSTQSRSTIQKRTPIKSTITGEDPQHSDEDTTNGISDSVLLDNNSNVPIPDESMATTSNQNMTQPSISRIGSSMKSLQVIFPSTSEVRYEDMFLLEKIAFIYIEIVFKHGFKAMTNRPFRNFAM